MVNFSMMTFLFFIVLPIGLCVLEIFLSRMDNKYIGLILPAITFIYSLIALLSFAIFDGATTGEIVVSMLTAFLGTNLPTLILLGIYFLCRENMRRKRQLDKMNKQLPIMFISGCKDPVGGMAKGVLKCIDAFKRSGMKDITIKLYPEGRHEMLNERNKDEVYQDVLTWLER